MFSAAVARKVGLGPRVAEWLRRTYPRDRLKSVQREFDVSRTQAARWLSGHTPTAAYIEEMAARWGAPFLAFAFQDIAVSEARLAQLERDIALLQAELIETGREVADLRSPSPKAERHESLVASIAVRLSHRARRAAPSGSAGHEQGSALSRRAGAGLQEHPRWAAGIGEAIRTLAVAAGAPSPGWGR